MLHIFSPGRINLIGEHTDYNQGYVLPAAISKGIQFSLEKNDANTINCYAEDIKEATAFSLSNPSSKDYTGWQLYFWGALQILQQKGIKLQGFNCSFSSTLPIGAGLSSSAALSCGFVFAINKLLHLGLSRKTIALIGQQVEHEFIGVKCGIMDQFASLMGEKDTILKIDCKSQVVAPISINQQNITILLINTKVKHSLAESAYNHRRNACQEGVELLQKHLPNIQSLRDISLSELHEFKSALSDDIFQKCLYVVEENQRVLDGIDALSKNNWAAFGEKMYLSHHGLSKLYEVSCKELDFLVEQSKALEGILGARMMGGGFGGCTINIVQNDALNTVIQQFSYAYEKQFGIMPETYAVNIGAGTHVCS